MSISDKDRKILWWRSGNRCALCRRVLVAARTATDDEAVVREEAHVAARSPGGPRYGECPSDAVDRYENLILLCAVHHTVIDDQHRQRPVLLVLDNASTDDQVLDLLPRQAVHRAVVTTRDTLSLPGARRLELDLLTQHETLRLLCEAV